MSLDQPTNQPTMGDDFPVNYLSVRLTLAHAVKDSVVNFFDYYDEYCIYMHKGGTSNEHYHICLSGLGGGDTERVRNRIKRAYAGVKHSIKQFTNGVRSFMFYCGHEGLEPTCKGSYWNEVKGTIDEYYQKKQYGQTMLPLQEKKGSKAYGESSWQLTYSNMVPTAINYARAKGLTGSLMEVLEDMFSNTKWKPSKALRQGGITDSYYKEYDFCSGKRKKYDMSWARPKWNE
jgi:hypothetical protein